MTGSIEEAACECLFLNDGDGFLKLLDKHPDLVNKKQDGPNRRSWMHMAALYGTVSVIEPLLQRGLSLADKDAGGNIPLHVAISGRHETFVFKLLEMGEVPTEVIAGYNALHRSISHESRGTAVISRHLLMHYRFDLNQHCHDMPPLHLAICNGSADAAKALLEAGADADVLRGGRTPLEYARQIKEKGCVDVLEGWTAARNASQAIRELTQSPSTVAKPLSSWSRP